jgi:ABC-type amino acid transport substrate-binding protein
MIPTTHIHHSRFLVFTLLVTTFFLGTTVTLLAQDTGQQTPLKVYTAPAPPFVIVEPERLTGFSIDLWKEIALRTDLEYEWVVIDRVPDIVEAVENGKADAGISAIVMNSEREKVLDFSHPFFISGLRVMTIKEPIRPFRNIFSAIFSLDVLKLFAAFFVLILIVANVVWFFERRTNSHFPKSYFAGLWEAVWWAAVTVTTVGYGDRVPLGKAGRILGLFWMVAGLFLVANLTAGVTAHITIKELQGQNKQLEDMTKSTMATITNTTVETFLTERGINYITAPTLEETHQLLLDGKAKGVVMDAHILSYYVQKYGNGELEVIGETFEEEFYGIALPIDSPHRELINQTLLDIMDDGTFNEIYKKWFGENVAW